MQTNPESAAVEAVAWLVTNGGETCEPWLVYERNEVEALPASCIADPLYPQSALDALRGEVERLRKSNELYSFAMNTAGIDELKRRADASDRRVAQLEIVLEQAMAHPDFLPPGLLEAIESALTKESP